MPQKSFFKLFTLLTIAVFFFCLNATCQDPNEPIIDSLLNRAEVEQNDSIKMAIYGKLFSLHYRKDITKAKEYLDVEMALAKESGLQKNIIGAKNRKGIYHSVKRENKRALVIFTELKDYYLKEGNQERAGSLYQNMASANFGLGNYKVALENQMKALEIDEKLGVSGVGMGHNYFTIGNIHRMIDNPKLSNEWMIKAKEQYEIENAKGYLAQVTYTLGINYFHLDSFELAEPLLQESETFFRQVGNKPALAIVLNALSNCTKHNGNFELAILQVKESMSLSENTGDIASMMETYDKLAQLQFLNKEYYKAIENGQKALDGAKSIHNRNYEAITTGRLSDYYAALKDFESSYNYIKAYNYLHDSISKEDNLAALSELEIKYQTEKKEQEILLLEEKARRSGIEKKALWGGILSLLGLIFLLFYAIKQRAGRSKLTKEKLEQELEFSIKELDLKKQELTGYAMQLANKNEILEEIKDKVAHIDQGIDISNGLRNITNTIHLNQTDDSTWESFMVRFQEVHKDFDTKILKSFPEITINELRLMALIKLKLSSKEIASIQNISGEGVKKARYRLRKKLKLESGDSLEDFVFQI